MRRARAVDRGRRRAAVVVPPLAGPVCAAALLLGLTACAGASASVEPAAPSSPDAPLSPDAVETPATPATPATPETPATPATPETPATPPTPPTHASPAAPPKRIPAPYDPLAHAAAPPSAALERVDRVREAYEAGMDRVLRAAATDPRTASYWPLRGLGEFWRGSVVWAEAAGAGYRPLEAQRGRRGWVAVVPAGHPGAIGSGRMLQVEPARGAHVIRIRPERVTEVWAGLFLIHELAHLSDRVQWGDRPWSSRHDYLEAELRAAELQLAAATAVSGGALTRNLDAALRAMRPRSVQDVVDRSLQLSGDDLDALTPPGLSGPAASAAERSLRHGFLRTGLVLRYGTLQDLDREMVLFGLDSLLLVTVD